MGTAVELKFSFNMHELPWMAYLTQEIKIDLMKNQLKPLLLTEIS